MSDAAHPNSNPRHRADAGGPLLQIRDLVVEFPTEEGIVHAVRGVDLDVNPGETLGIVGE